MKQQTGAVAKPLPKELLNAPSRATIEITQNARQKMAEKALEAASPSITISLSSMFGFGEGNGNESSKSDQKPQSSNTKPSTTKQTMMKTPPKPSQSAKSSTSSSSTISIGTLFNDEIAASARALPITTAPKGVPTIERWKAEKDKSITGFIRGSNQFRDGEKVTTSPIKRGRVAKNEVVTTGSGSKYFLG